MYTLDNCRQENITGIVIRNVILKRGFEHT